MFCKKKKETEDRSIKDLERRICDLENPYKFNIGDYVHCILFDNTNDFGTVVDREHEYVDNSHQFRILWHSYTSPATYIRKNYYKVYFEQSKVTHSVSELQLSLQKQKK